MAECERVLVVEDEALIGEELRERLTRMGLAVDGPIRSGSMAIDAVKASQPDLVLMDIRLGNGMDGIEAAQRIRADFDIPIVFLSAYSDDLTIRRAAASTPFGYLLKPTSDAHLRATIPTVLQRHRAERCSRGAAETRASALLEAAMRDPLTGLWNRRGILQALDTEVARAARQEDATVGVFMIDIDRFKAVNDRYGHLAGDAVIREVVRRMSTVTRAYDTVGRYGGDEFLLVSSNSRWTEGSRLAQRLERAVASDRIDLEDASVAVSVSVGFCVRSCGPRLDPTTLIKAADQSLYAAKATRRQEARPRVVASVNTPLILRIRGEFAEMAGLSLSLTQARRLFGVDEPECQAALESLIESKFLVRTRVGSFIRRLS